MSCCKIKPSDLNRKITISSLVVTPTDTGGQEQSLVVFSTPWAKIKNLSGNELIRYGKIGAEAISKFTIRYKEGLTESMIITRNGEDFNILHIDNIDEQDEFITLTAKRGVNK